MGRKKEKESNREIEYNTLFSRREKKELTVRPRVRDTVVGTQDLLGILGASYVDLRVKFH